MYIDEGGGDGRCRVGGTTLMWAGERPSRVGRDQGGRKSKGIYTLLNYLRFGSKTRGKLAQKHSRKTWGNSDQKVN